MTSSIDYAVAGISGLSDRCNGDRHEAIHWPNLTFDWRSIFAIDVPILELVVRGSIIYVAIFILLRTTMRRTAGQLTMLDIVIILLIAGVPRMP